MKKLLFLLLLPFALLAQNPTSFPYGVKITGGQPTVLSNPTFVTTTATNGVQGKIPYDNLLNGRTAQGDTGVIDFGGLTTNSATTINIGYVVGYVVDNETDPETPVVTKVSYAGESNKTVTTVGSGQASYVMLSSAGVISFQNTFPTSAERKAKIWLGKVSHPAGSITLVTNEPDYTTSPQAFARDLFQVLGPYVNDGVFAYANGANLNINITGGNIHGNGINFVNSKTSPNELAMGPGIAQAFLIRTQTGAGSGATTSITPGSYDVGGTITAIPGSSNQATIQYIWAVPGQGYIVQLGQTLYSSFSAAVEALGREASFVIYPNLPGNAIPITALVVTKGCSSLADTGVTAQFFRANRTGEFFGATAGVSTANFQTTYLNSLIPQITTTTALGAVTVRRGSASDTDNIIVGQNGAGTNTFAVNGNGKGYLSSLGVNTQSPFYTTEILQPINTTGLFLTTPAATNGDYSELSFGKSGANTRSTQIRSIFTSPATTNDAHLAFFTTSTTNNERLRITNDGNILVNTMTNIGERFTVNGSLYSTGRYTLNGQTSGADTHIRFLNNSSNVAFLGSDSGFFGSGASNFTVHVYGSNDFIIGTNSNRRVIVKGSGNTLFNTTTDTGVSTDIVQVNGDILVKKVRMRNVADTFTSDFTNTNTAARTYTLPDRTDTVATLTDLTPLITITTAVSITTATTGGSGIGQNGKHVVIDNGVNAINLTCNGGVTSSYGKVGSGAITFVQGSGRTLVQLSGTAILNGAVGSTATLWSNGTTDYLSITNY